MRIDAADYNEYRKRVDYLYEVCQKNGIDVDTQNRNPSRLSRMPGVQRGEKKQFIVDTNIGKQSWNEWYEWIEVSTMICRSRKGWKVYGITSPSCRRV